jgi:Rrf2 family nitric oxide-sensitive transcriptional repressor
LCSFPIRPAGGQLPSRFDRRNAGKTSDKIQIRMRLNKSTSHAVRILIDCAKAEGRLIKVAEIAERLDITPQNAFKIVHLLSKAGFLGSVRGRHGGVRLARPAAKIRIGDVVRSIETMGPEEKGTGGRGSLHRIVDDALDAFISVLDQHTLEDMAAAHQAQANRDSGGRTGKAPLRAPASRTRRGQQSAPRTLG